MEITIFDPRGIKEYRNKYPELKRVTEFHTIPENMLVLIWYFANETSPFANIELDSERMEKAIEASGVKMDYETKTKFKAGKYDDKIRGAIIKMRSFVPDLRIRGKKMADNVFDKLEEITKLNASDFKTAGEIDYNKYISAQKQVMKEISEMIKLVEEGFGVKDKKEKQMTFNGQENINKFLQENKGG